MPAPVALAPTKALLQHQPHDMQEQGFGLPGCVTRFCSSSICQLVRSAEVSWSHCLHGNSKQDLVQRILPCLPP